MMTEYNVFIHYNIENNVWEEEVSVIKDRVKMLHNVKETLLKWWKNAVTSQVKVYNKKHYLKTYKKEDLVLLLIKNLSQKCLHKKLLHKFAELFCICDIIKKQAYWLSLSITYQIHDVFHVFYLKSYNWHQDNDTVLKLSSSELTEQKEKYEVKKILKRWIRKEELWYKVSWKGYSSEYNQWIFEENMSSA